ncbi:hypothetical protein AVDCRST_MAG84-2886 [uncultured Microcoleus sp.]|uniref:DUF6883 domain-containing protein n=1 Tax=uncultured Microcoleus sp. TaxID=259945 RepID=A0A6J4M6G8_9CYAN|nr:hypothetical protein AVDCRST_MAG84-2886 [uncultured Microcoleus sp.]
MKLPNAEAAFIDIHKLRDYSLNMQHDRGKHKARLFLAILGLSVENAEERELILLEAIQIYDAISSSQDEYGQRYLVDFPLTRNGNTATIRITWIVRSTETFPRLTSCYIRR